MKNTDLGFQSYGLSSNRFCMPVTEYSTDTRHPITKASSPSGRPASGVAMIVSGYGQMVQDRVSKGWSCDLLTFTFNPMSGSEDTLKLRMSDEVARVYSTFVTRTHRRPRSQPLDQLPLLIGVADLPVCKRDKTSSGSADRQNDGLHYHCLLVVPPATRLRTSVTDHFEKSGIYLRRGGLIQRLHARRVVSDPAYVVDYVFKNVLRGRLSYDGSVLVLPRCGTERS